MLKPRFCGPLTFMLWLREGGGGYLVGIHCDLHLGAGVYEVYLLNDTCDHKLGRPVLKLQDAYDDGDADDGNRIL